MLKIAHDLSKVKEIIEEKYSKNDILKADIHLRQTAAKKKIPYITYLRIIGRTEGVSALGRLLALYLLYLN